MLIFWKDRSWASSCRISGVGYDDFRKKNKAELGNRYWQRVLFQTLWPSERKQGFIVVWRGSKIAGGDWCVPVLQWRRKVVKSPFSNDKPRDWVSHRACFWFTKKSLSAAFGLLVFMRVFVGCVGGGWRWGASQAPVGKCSRHRLHVTPAKAGPQADRLPNP